MSLKKTRLSQLAPLSIELRTTLAVSAVNFYSPMNYQKNCEILGKDTEKGKVYPLSTWDFIEFLKRENILEEPLRYVERIRHLLDRMAATGILTDMGYDSKVMTPKKYYFLKELTTLQRDGVFWLSPALGDDFLFHLFAPGIVHITGVNKTGDVCAGTGIVFHPHHILTCEHVLNDAEIDERQKFQNINCTISEKFAHPKVDVAVIRTDQALRPVHGISFVSPRIAQTVFTLGYPKISFAREAALVMQRGEVTNESVVTLDGQTVFLFSAISRPGNSGGPIISSDGHVVGITIRGLRTKDQDDPFSPYYAGVPTQEIVAAINDFDIGIQIPVEDYI